MTMHRNIANTTSAATALRSLAVASVELVAFVVVILIPPPRCGMSA
jgi:hypothetical protein